MSTNPYFSTGQQALPAVNLQSVLQRVYLWMLLGLLLTAGVAFYTVNSNLITLAMNQGVFFGAIIGELVLVIALSAGLRRMSAGLATGMFLLYAALNGFTLSLIFLIYELGSIYMAFFDTAILFGVMSVIGMTTKIDLTRVGSYLMMGVIGLLIAMIANLFFNSGPFGLIINIAGVLIFTALTAYDTQKIKQLATDPEFQSSGEMAHKLSLLGALRLYLDFINLFLFLLRLFGRRR
jgi:FtsH-binding integral membrane protein